ncbi:MAG: thiamine biosynthesis protein ThiS [Candidatus Cloacimonas sp. 4484_143]|nr:MAG: thiamine biosynthesis protein ThiS [Candidatus Cloacimonas sp. 4484_143]RLC52163.1 MAG: thiamine biosynthesis protein ThiS [Candidatus Cloacimonadota bacterium]RLC58778.1 MAG: thiamine biosynthesis protein ThiS [Candidatus Cloacimonadota bacterium]
MIKVNNNEMPWEKGLTVEKLLRENNFLIHLSIVKINSILINRRSFATQVINDNDNLTIIHLVAGG